jgi:ArsR family transcriptional regulator
MFSEITSISRPANLEFESLAHFCKASADELRLLILRVLRNDSYSVQELCLIFDLKQSAMSHHLKVLAAAHWVTTRREGNSIFYRRLLLAHDSVFAPLQQALFNSVDACDLTPPIVERLQTVEENRTQCSREFFVENAAKFREQQDLIASFDHYADSVADVLQAIPLSGKEHALEVGPGEGLFLNTLCREFKQVSAFDTSSAMLAQAKQWAAKSSLNNITLYCGDTRKAATHFSNAIDCVVINMVLHHVASPADVFNDVSACLKPGGALIVTDLCHHDQEWAKTACGDVWMGFDPDDLTHWAKQAGLLLGQSSYLAQRNGFKVQIQHFYKPKEHNHE